MAETEAQAVDQTTVEEVAKAEETTNETTGKSEATDVAATIAGTAAQAKEADDKTETAEAQQAQKEEVVYDFKESIPSNFEWSEEESNKFVEVIKDMNLSNEQANEIAKYGLTWAQGIVNGIGEQILEERKGWAETAKQELGTDFDKTVRTCGVAVEHIEKTVPGIRQALNETGAGNRIEIIKALSILGEMLAGDPGMVAKAGETNNPVANELANRYPNTDFKKYL